MFVQRRSALAVSEKMLGGSNEGEGQAKAKEVCPFLGVARRSRPLPLGGRGGGGGVGCTWGGGVSYTWGGEGSATPDSPWYIYIYIYIYILFIAHSLRHTASELIMSVGLFQLGVIICVNLG